MKQVATMNVTKLTREEKYRVRISRGSLSQESLIIPRWSPTR